MISFRSFSLVISVVLLRQAALQASSGSVVAPYLVDQPFNWLICGTVLFCVIGKFLPVFAMIRADTAGRSQGWREMEQNRNWLEWAWVVTQGFLLANSGAGRALANCEHQGWPAALMIAAWFIPTIVFFFALEFGFTQLECLWSTDGDQSSHAHWVRWSERIRLGVLGNVLTCVVPVVLLLGAMDAIRFLLPALPELWQASLALVCLGIVGLTFTPLWLQLWMGARALPADHVVVQRAAYLAKIMQVPSPRVCEVGPRKSWHGVALVGWTPMFRQLWIGATVVPTLTAEQLDMVLLHELAHLKRGHCWWRIIPLLVVGIACVVAMTCWPMDAFGIGQLIMSVTFAIGMIWLLSAISKHCELDADRQACLAAVNHCEWADRQPACAVNMLASALVVLHDPDQNPTRAQWLHPSLAQRIAVKL